MFSRRRFCFLAGAAALRAQPAGKVRIGVVGGNFGASFFWRLHPSSEVAAVCDLREDRLQRLKKTYNPNARGYSSYSEMLQTGGLDAVAVFTPVPLHAEMVIQAVRAGYHVISAVPVAHSLAACEEVLAAVRRSGCTYMMAETSYYRPEVVWAREAQRERKFGDIFFSEAEYYHQGLFNLWYDEQRRPTWRFGVPPLHYITHASSMVISVSGERLVEVSAHGYGDGRPELQKNPHNNPFMDEVGMFKTSSGRAARIAIFRDIAIGGTERASWFGTKLTYRMPQPGGLAGVLGHEDEKMENFRPPNYWDRLPEPLRQPSGHGGSHTFLTHEFVSAIREKRRPAVDIYEALSYTAPGFAGHQSALQGGALMK
ncbi:MAG: Gfo/Idh/MocA family oxidoreductase, partial [Acidobacteria bacterium]|nr:Gfo/Idh/MocA family oxidoreductase [Acidobacteriota bacterium]